MSSKLEYLKRYMSAEDVGSEDKPKKKKKSKKKAKAKQLGGFKIIDNDLGFNAAGIDSSAKRDDSDEEALDEDAYALGEEKPQVAAVVDERPPELSGKWKRMNKDEEKTSRKRHDSSDESPARRPRHDSDNSPPRKLIRGGRHDSDESPPRVKRTRHDSDNSPPRKGRARHDSDESPPRKGRAKHDSDESPPRVKRTRHDSDESPPRKGRARHDSDKSPPRKGRARHDSDASPPRRSDTTKIKSEPLDSDASPPRLSGKATVKQEPDSDASPPRKRSSRWGQEVKQEPVDSDASPPRRKNQGDSDASPPRRRKADSSDESPPRRRDSKLQTKTLDGKKAGLQSAKGLKSEMEELRKRERDRIDALSADVSGRNAETKVRGRYKEKLEEESRRKEKAAIPDEVKAKYAAWSKGEAQIKADRQKLQEDLHEMSKPLARDANDGDLDAHLKAIDREEDPMLAYIKQKRAKKTNSDVTIERFPEYKGPQPAPNRFGIRPGYRWDGVDRSTGFEKKLFDAQTQRKARANEAHMWSTEDM